MSERFSGHFSARRANTFHMGETEVDLVRRELRASDPDLWPEVPRHGEYSRDRILRALDSIDAAVRKTGQWPDHTEALERTTEFVDQAFAVYDGSLTPELPADRAFVVPSRMLDDDPVHGGEIAFVLPLLDSRYGVESWVVRRFFAALPPMILSTYGAADGRQGKVVSAPVSAAVIDDLGARAGYAMAQRIVSDAAEFAHRRLGAPVAGLAATLPTLTRYGRTIDVPGLVTTTGHGGTVHMVRRLVEDVLGSGLVSGAAWLGVVGAAGTMGQAVLAALLDAFPDVPILACDLPNRLGRIADGPPRLCTTSDVTEVFAACEVVVSAITQRLDLDAIAAAADLAGRVLIDDSQPGCVDRLEWEKHGGVLLWPVGTATSDSPALRRIDGYRYGEHAGLLTTHDHWCCEAEAAAIGLTGEFGAALRGPVTPEAARRIGRLCEQVGLGAAQPQSYAQPVRLPA